MIDRTSKRELTNLIKLARAQQTDELLTEILVKALRAEMAKERPFELSATALTQLILSLSQRWDQQQGSGPNLSDLLVEAAEQAKKEKEIKKTL